MFYYFPSCQIRLNTDFSDVLLIQRLHCRDPFCGSFILDQAGVNTMKFSIFQLSPILHIFALLGVTLRANDVKYDVNDVGR